MNLPRDINQLLVLKMYRIKTVCCIYLKMMSVENSLFQVVLDEESVKHYQLFSKWTFSNTLWT